MWSTVINKNFVIVMRFMKRDLKSANVNFEIVE